MWNRSPGPREKALPSSMTTRQRPETTSPTCSRSEEHTSELQSQSNLVCRLLLEKKKNTFINNIKANQTSFIKDDLRVVKAYSNNRHSPYSPDKTCRLYVMLATHNPHISNSPHFG